MSANHKPPAAMLCPRCRKLVGRNDRRCPHCGLPAPAALGPVGAAVRAVNDPEHFLRALIYTNVALYVVSVLLSPSGPSLTLNPLRFLSPDLMSLRRIGATGVQAIDQLGWWWTLVSASYLHGGLLHIFFNMAALRQIAPLIIREFGIFRMFVIYTISGVAGFFASYLADVVITIGASAALCGLLGAAIYYGKSRGGLYGHIVYRQMSGWAVGLILIGLMPGINNWAHGGGFVGGLLLALLLGYEERRAAGWLDTLIGGGLMLLTVLVLLLAVATGIYYRFW